MKENEHYLALTYKITLPARDTKEYDELVAEFLKGEDTEFKNDPENYEPDVMNGNLCYYLLAQSHAGNYTEMVELTFDQLD